MQPRIHDRRRYRSETMWQGGGKYWHDVSEGQGPVKVKVKNKVKVSVQDEDGGEEALRHRRPCGSRDAVSYRPQRRYVTTPCLKKRPTFTTCCNFYIRSSIATIFGANVAEKVGNQNVLYFPTSPN